MYVFFELNRNFVLFLTQKLIMSSIYIYVHDWYLTGSKLHLSRNFLLKKANDFKQKVFFVCFATLEV